MMVVKAIYEGGKFRLLEPIQLTQDFRLNPIPSLPKLN